MSKLSTKMRKIWWQVAITNTINKQFLTFWITNYSFRKLSNENKNILIMGNFNRNLLNYYDKNTANSLDTMFSYSYLHFINIPTRATGYSKTLIDNFFYNKTMLKITAKNISHIVSDPLIQFLIEPSATNAKLEETCKLQRWYKNFDKTKFKNDLYKIRWKEHCGKPDSNIALKQFLKIINKLWTNMLHTLCRSLALFLHPNLG